MTNDDIWNTHGSLFEEVTLFSFSLNAHLIEAGPEREKRIIEPVYNVSARSSLIGKASGAHYKLKIVTLSAGLQLTFDGSYFALCSVDPSTSDDTLFKKLLVNVGSVVIWPRFRDLCMLAIAQSEWHIDPIPTRPKNINFLSENLK